MEIRELKAKDVKTLAKMLGKLKNTSIGDLLIMMDTSKVSTPQEKNELKAKINGEDDGIRKAAQKRLDEIAEAENIIMMNIGLSLFHVVAADLTDDIYTWLADLIKKTPEEFDDMPVDTPVQIISELVNRGDFKSFFGLATQQVKTPKPSPDSTTS